MILFLDFDGVLHPEPCYRREDLFCRKSIFEEVVHDFPDLEIVISSTWRRTHTLSQLRDFFSPETGAKIVGVTPEFADLPELESVIGPYPRHVEIEGWLRSNRPWDSWLALDDKRWWFRPFCKNLIGCTSKTGMDVGTAEALRAKLARERT